MGLGVAYSLINTPTNWVKLDPTIINLGGNYTFDQHKHSTFSLLINPKIEFPITRIFGLSLSPVICINKDITYFGVGIGYMLAIKS